MRLKIRYKILLAFAFLLLLSSLVQAFTFIITRNYISSRIDTAHELEAKRGAHDLQDFFTDINNQTYSLARIYRDTIVNASGSATENLIFTAKHIVANNDEIREVTYLSTSGRELYKFHNEGQVLQDQLNYEVYTDSFKNAVSGKTAFSKVYYFERDLGPHIDVFSPIIDIKQDVKAVVKVQVGLEALRKELSEITYGDYGQLYVVDDEGRLIAHPSQKYVLDRPNLNDRPLVSKIINNEKVTASDYTYTNEKNIKVLAKAVKVPGINWIAVVEQPISEAYGFLTVIRNVFIITLISSTVVLLIIASLVSTSLASGIKKLQESAQKIESGELKTSILIKSGDEIESLSNSFGSMVNRLLMRENQIMKEKQETETMLQSLADGVIALNQDNKIIAFNKAAHKITGLNDDVVIGKDIDEALDVYSDGQKVPFVFYYNKTHTGKTVSLKESNLSLIKDNGEKVAIELTADQILFQDQRVGTIIVIHDITKEKQLEEMKLDFVSMAAHELRTPLTSIRGYLSVFMEEDIVLNEEQKTFLQRMNISCDQLMALVENLLNITRIERGAMALNVGTVNWMEIVNTVFDQIYNRAVEKNIAITIKQPEKVLPTVEVDSFRISEVLTNLIANAINYTDAGGSVTISFEEIYGEVITHIADTGQGIPKEALPRLFTKFFRVSGKLEQGSKGTGLGLYIAKAIVEMHHGKIWVDSSVGRGSTFSFSVPASNKS